MLGGHGLLGLGLSRLRRLGVPSRGEVVFGEPAAMIAAFARSSQSDLIMGPSSLHPDGAEVVRSVRRVPRGQRLLQHSSRARDRQRRRARGLSQARRGNCLTSQLGRPARRPPT